MVVEDALTAIVDSNLLSFPNEPPAPDATAAVVASSSPLPLMSALFASEYGYLLATSFAVACCKTDGAKIDEFEAVLLLLLLLPPPPPPPLDDLSDRPWSIFI